MLGPKWAPVRNQLDRNGLTKMGTSSEPIGLKWFDRLGHYFRLPYHMVEHKYVNYFSPELITGFEPRCRSDNVTVGTAYDIHDLYARCSQCNAS